ncbi:MAG: TrkH family potassium uptake protein [Pseudomonadota bacterium]
MDYRPIFFITGILLSTLAVSMIFPMLIDLYYNNPDWKTFFLCIIWTGFFGGILILSNVTEKFTLSIRQAFLLTSSSWIVLALFSALPLWLSELNLSFTDSFFEAMSGITTTGSTILTDIESAPPGILLWRAILQWLGGIGIIVMALSVLPFLKVGGMQLFRTESSENEKAMPRAAKLAGSIGFVYFGLTMICAICYTMSGLTPFDSIAHAMTTVATGGFSTFNSSFADHQSIWLDITAIVFMVLGGLPFVLYLKAINGNPGALFRDSQVKMFFGLITLSIFVMTLYLIMNMTIPLSEALRKSAFNVISIITGTGYVNGDYVAWGGFAVSMLFFLMVVGGCAGSTTCGIKIFRFQVLMEVANTQFKQLLHPNGVFIPHYNGRPIPTGVPRSVIGFFFLYALVFALLAIALSFIGLDFLTAMSGAATSLSNVGPGLGSVIGPTGTFEPLPDAAKWILCVGMILGRLELFTLLIIFSPAFWKK